MNIDFYLQPKQLKFKETVETTPITFYGGAKGGGKSKGVRDIMLLRRFQYAGTHGGLFRRTYKELEGNHIRPLFKEYPQLKQFWTDSKKLLTLPNGSTLEFCHAESEADVDLYQGREFEDLAIEEAGQWLEAMFRKLLGSNRSSKAGFRPRCLLTGNPGGIGHAWLKRLFVERRFNSFERPSDYAFIQALVDDNPALIENDPDYVHKLESEPNEALRKAYRYGDWDIFAGQYFGEIRREIHFIRPFAIPSHWQRFGAYDFGFNHPAAFGWFANDSDGNVYLYRELVKAGLRVDQFASEIKKYDDTKDLYMVVGGLDCWNKRDVIDDRSSPTIAEEWAKDGIYLTRAKVDRVPGANQVRNYLAWQNLASGRTKPRLFIFNTCPISFDCLTRMQHDPKHIEDVLKVDAAEGDPLTGDDCFARGTLISTDKGQKPIELIMPGDMVWTRKGLKPVVDAWMNSLSSNTLKLICSDGSEVIATPNHKFWTDEGFRSLDSLSYGDNLLCLNQNQSSLMESLSDVSLNQRIERTDSITTLLGMSAKEAWELCIRKSGKQLMDLFPRGTTFITPMGIHSTTGFRIWSQSILNLMFKSISKTQLEWQKVKSILSVLDPLLLPGISQSLVANGTLRMLYAPTLNAKGSKHVVCCAPKSFIALIQRRLSSVVEHASLGRIDNLSSEWPNALAVARNSNTAIPSKHRPCLSLVHSNVEAVLDGGRRDTYSLHVAECHEYFANGKLVRNCYDMIRYGLMSRPMLTDEPRKIYKPGTVEWAKDFEEQLFDHNVGKVRKEQDVSKNGDSERTWTLDSNGAPPWSQW